MKHKLALSISGVILLAISLAFMPFLIGKVKAAITTFTPSTCYNFAATSSLSYLSKGAGTTTVTCNLGAEGASVAVAKVTVNASSTVTRYNFNIEESMDGIDWFVVTPSITASTSPVLFFDALGQLTYLFASSTVGQVALGGAGTAGVDGTNNRQQFLFDIPVRMKQVRVITTLASSTAGAGSGNGAVNLQIVPRQQQN